MAKKEVQKEDSGKELLMALEILEKEKDISKETMFDAIETSLLTACKQHYGKSDNMRVEIDRETGKFKVFAQKTVVMKPEDNVSEIAKEEAKRIDPGVKVGDVLDVEVESKDFGRIATTNAKNVILATGGYPGNPKMLKALSPIAMETITGAYFNGSDRGMGIRAGLWAGASKNTEPALMIFDRGIVPPGVKAGYIEDENGNQFCSRV